MTSRLPPRFATWLLQRCLRGRHVESLIGDLLELQQAGRSRWWYWRQVLTAIFVGGVDAVRSSGRSLILALAVGWGAIVVWIALNAIFIAHSDDIYRNLRAAGLDRNGGLLIVWCLGASLRLICFVGIGWLVARLNARHPVLATITFAASVLIIPVSWHQIRVLEYETQLGAHYGTALLGIFVGMSFVGARPSETNTPSNPV
jgi:hypothetical protein